MKTLCAGVEAHLQHLTHTSKTKCLAYSVLSQMVAKFYHDAARWLTTMATITSIKDEICFVNITYMLLLILRKSHILTFLNHKSRLEIKCPPCIEPISQIAECCPHLLAQLLNLLT